MLEAQHLVCEYKDGAQQLRILDGVSLKIDQGTTVAFVGPSGSGKSSLLYLLAGIRTPAAGSVLFRGQPLEKMSQKARSMLRATTFGFVFQQHFLVKHMTVMENVFVSVAHPTRETLTYAETLLKQLGLNEMGHRFPGELSGGQRQRVALARALINRPVVLFADEPTASLDRVASEALMELLVRLKAETTLVMVTHDPSVLTHFDRVVEIDRGQLQEQQPRSGASRRGGFAADGGELFG